MLVALGCEQSGATDDPGPPLDDQAFSQQWILIDRVPSGRAIAAVAHGDDGFVAVARSAEPTIGGSDVLARSTDGVTWTEVPLYAHYLSIAHGMGRYVVVGDNTGSGPHRSLIIVSDDGLNFREVSKSSLRLHRVRFTPGGFIAVGDLGAVVFSPDGENWSGATGGERNFVDVAFGAGRFVAVGRALAISSDGFRWVRLECGTLLPCPPAPTGERPMVSLGGVIFGNDHFLATGEAGLLRSQDGQSWFAVGAPRNARLLFHRGLFLDLADSVPESEAPVAVSVSDDGVSWLTRTTVKRLPTADTCATKRCLVFESAIVLVP